MHPLGTAEEDESRRMNYCRGATAAVYSAEESHGALPAAVASSGDFRNFH